MSAESELLSWSAGYALRFLIGCWCFAGRVPSLTRSPFGSAAAAAFYWKRSCSRLVKEKWGIVFTGTHLFSAFETQHLRRKKSLRFTVHVNCTVQWTVQVTWTVHCGALFMRAVQGIALFTISKWTVQFSCTAWALFLFFIYFIKKNEFRMNFIHYNILSNFIIC